MQFTGERLRTTSAQYGIWVAQLADEAGSDYWTAEIIGLRGEPELAALQASVAEVLDQCHALHMLFEWDEDTLWQRPQPASTQVLVRDFSAEPDPRVAAMAWMRTALARPCNVTRDALYHTAVLRLSHTEHWWYLQTHHIVLDGFGYSLIQQAVAQRYNARVRGQPLPDLPPWTIHGVVRAEVDYRRDGRFERDRAFWLEQLRDVPAPLRLAVPGEISPEPWRQHLELTVDEVAALQRAAHAAQCDWAAWMLAVMGLWLGQRGGQRHFTIGLPVMNRLGTPAMGVPSMTMNIVPLAMHLNPQDSLQGLVRATARQLRAMRPHLYYRYGWIRGDLGLIENGKFLFNQAVNLMPFDRRVSFAGLHSHMRPVSGGPVKDFNLLLVVLDGRWRLTLEANANAYRPDDVAAMACDLRQWLVQMARQPSETRLADLPGAWPPLSVLSGPPLDGVPDPVLMLIQRHATRQPRREAIRQADRVMDYLTLMRRTETCAAHLAARGVRAGDVVAVLLPRSCEAVVAMLAVLWLGAVYAPLDPQGPPERMALMFSDATPAHVITHAAFVDMVHEWARDGALTCLDACGVWQDGAMLDKPPLYAAAPRQPAYLLYTSGSTGKPNGVLVGHGALAHYVASTQRIYQITPADRLLQFAPLHFDASLEEIFMTLCHGATLVLRDDAMLDSARRFAAAVQQQGVTVLDLPTAYWHTLAHALDTDGAALLRRVRLTIIGGEAAQAERAARWRELFPGQTLLNTYGPTEASIIATTAVLGGPRAAWQPGQAVPIGLPRPGVDVRVIDERGYPVVEGRVGELALCGEALALEYLRQPELTERRFMALPDTGARAYRTGDLVCWRHGQLRFVGRGDSEVKISGLRIDPAEVENALLGIEQVREAAVVPLHGGAHGPMLAAFVVLDGQGRPALDEAGLREAVAARLPAPAVPAVWRLLDRLPRNANGKIDRQALPALLPTHTHPRPGISADALEHAVIMAWREVLGEGCVLNGDAHFFDLGGKSLQAIQVAGSLSRGLGRDVAVSLLFRHPTLRALVQALRAPQAYLPPRTQDPFAPLLLLQSAMPSREGAEVADVPALFCLHPADGLAWAYLRLAHHLPDVTIHGMQLDVAQSRQATHFDALAAGYARRIRALQPHGPYRLLGWSLGGALAYAVAVQLRQAGESVALLALLDCYPAPAWAARAAPTLTDVLQILLEANGDFDTAGLSDQAMCQRLLRPGSPFAVLGASGLERHAHEAWRQMRMFRASQPQPYDGEVLMFQAARNPAHIPRPDSWHRWIAPQRLHCEVLECAHAALSDPAPMAAMAGVLKHWLRASVEYGAPAIPAHS
ncbi:MAG: amino acid adenylation domain-containing protein [Pseudomonadota bacterium]|nr:amino acid adenylation domain-containing protein [Pseudomonadota bacterium]